MGEKKKHTPDPSQEGSFWIPAPSLRWNELRGNEMLYRGRMRYAPTVSLHDPFFIDAPELIALCLLYLSHLAVPFPNSDDEILQGRMS